MITNEALLAGLEKAFLSDRPHYKLGSRDYQYYAHDLADIAPAFRCEDLGAMLRRQFGKGKGSELKPKDNAPPKMHAVHSSSAQCVNAFALPAFFLGRDSDFWSKFFGQDVWNGFDEWSFEAQDIFTTSSPLARSMSWRFFASKIFWRTPEWISSRQPIRTLFTGLKDTGATFPFMLIGRLGLKSTIFSNLRSGSN